MPGKILRIAIKPPQKRAEFENLLIEFKDNGHCAIGVVENVGRIGYSVDILATDDTNRNLPVLITVPFKNPYRNIDREDLPVYVGLKNVSPRFEDILRGDE